MSSKKHGYVGICLSSFFLFLCVTLLIYAGVFSSEWVYDDFPVIVNNPDVTSMENFMADSYPGRPLRELTYLLDYSLWGFRPGGFLFQNLLWHAFCGWLVMGVGCRLGLGRLSSVFAGLYFLVHPLAVEVAAHAAHRKDSLALAFSLLALLAFLRYLDPSPAGRWWLLTSVFLLIGGFFSKENALAVLPVAFACWVWSRDVAKRTVLWGAGAAGVAGAALLVALVQTTFWQERAKLHFLKVQMTGDFGAWDYYLYMLKAWGFMFFKLLWPADLSIEYVVSPPEALMDPWRLFPLMLLVLSVWVLVASWGKNRALFAGILFFWAFWLPVSNLLPLAYFAADRYLYAPMAGVALVLGAGLDGLSTGWRRAALPPVVLVLVLLGVLSFEQQQVWRNNLSLWSHAYRVTPESSTVLNNLGNLALERGALGEASNFYRRSLQRDPFNHAARYNLGYIAEMQGRFAEAVEHYREFVKYEHPEAMFRQAAEALRKRFGWPPSNASR